MCCSSDVCLALVQWTGCAGCNAGVCDCNAGVFASFSAGMCGYSEYVCSGVCVLLLRCVVVIVQMICGWFLQLR